MKNFALLFLLGVVPAWSAPQDEDFIPLKKNTRWVYRLGDNMEVVQTITGTEKVNGVECHVFESDVRGQKERMWVTADKNGAWLYKAESGGSASELAKPAMLLKYPMKQGDTWESTIPAGGANIDYQFENAGEEELTVPAGKYKAWKIVMKGRMEKVTFTGTYWYAKGVGLILQIIKSPGGEFRLTLKEHTK